jgi:hypothetical protein
VFYLALLRQALQVPDSSRICRQHGLSEARNARLIDDESLSSASSDVQVAGPALCLLVAALRSQGDPPSITVPNPSSIDPRATLTLSSYTCPTVFSQFLQAWARAVPPIKSLDEERQQALARILCDLEPLTSPIDLAVVRLGSDLKALAVEISQRRTFRQRYRDDLQQTLHSKSSWGSHEPAFVSPPDYEPPRPESSDSTAIPVALVYIRETLYSALFDALSTSPFLHSLLQTDPARGYFTSVSLAILSFASSPTSLSADGRLIRVVQAFGPDFQEWIGEEDCPIEYAVFFRKILGLFRRVRILAEADDRDAVRLAEEGELGDRLEAEIPTETRLERLKRRLEEGVAHQSSSPGGTVAELANAIGRLALGMCQLPNFVQRQDEVFKVLAGLE